MVERTQEGHGRARSGGGLAHAARWTLSLVYVVQAYAMMALMSLWFTPWAAVDRRGAHAGVRTLVPATRGGARGGWWACTPS